MGSSVKSLEYYKVLCTSIHKGLYNYDDWITLEKYHNKIPIVCNIHGKFFQSLANHLTHKSGCPECRRELRTKGLNALGWDVWVNKAITTHNGKYSYSCNNFTSADISIINITCPIHGDFNQKFSDHVRKKAGCPYCAKQKRINTQTQKYGVPHHKQQHYSNDTSTKLNDKIWLETQHHINQRPLENIAIELNVQDTTVGNYFSLYNIEVKRFSRSVGERELERWLSQYTTVICNTRTIISPLELDIFLPEHNIAIEYCGLYWHSSSHKTSQYHYDKYISCRDQGIKLITIYEDEWKQKASIIKTKLLHIINKSNLLTVFARKTTIVPISLKQKREFFNINHIQGNGPSSINRGLLYNNQLVACIGLIVQGSTLLINRYATSCIVPGGFTKLLNDISTTYQWNQISTFADLRWSSGQLYINNGFNVSYQLRPDYYWTDGKTRWHKFGFRHKLLNKKLTKYDPALTEAENCFNNGLFKIFDCGKIKYQIKSDT